MEQPSDAFWATGELIDRIIATDYPRRGVIDLIYPLARAYHGRPLAAAAADLLAKSVRPGQVVLIATGWLDRPHVSTAIAETDGPPGAAALAYAIHRGLDAVPFILVEEEILEATIATVQAAGLRCLSPDQALAATQSRAAIHAAAVLPFPSDWDRATAEATRIYDAYDVAGFIAIEKGGRNSQGRIHTSRGDDTTEPLAKADALLEEARKRGIASIGIGDGGNEIGMGTIADELAPRLRFGQGCRCGCGSGVVPAGATDVLVSAAVSNWGGYAVAAALGARLGRTDVLHDEHVTEDVLRAAAGAGFIDGVSGYVAPSADGLPLVVQLAAVTLLRALTGVGVDLTAWPG